MENPFRKWMRLIQETLEEYFDFIIYCEYILDAAKKGNVFWATEEIKYWETWIENEHYLTEQEIFVFSRVLLEIKTKVMEIWTSK